MSTAVNNTRAPNAHECRVLSDQTEPDAPAPEAAKVQSAPPSLSWMTNLDAPVLPLAKVCFEVGETVGNNLLGREVENREFSAGAYKFENSISIRVGALRGARLKFMRGGAIRVTRSVSEDSSVSTESRAAVVIQGNLLGDVSIGGGAVYVGQNVVGTLRVGSSALVVVGGDVSGTIEVRNDCNVFVRGQVTGHVKVPYGSTCKIYFWHDYALEDLKAMKGKYSQCTLVLAGYTTLPLGENRVKLGSWRRILVQPRAWPAQ